MGRAVPPPFAARDAARRAWEAHAGAASKPCACYQNPVDDAAVFDEACGEGERKAKESGYRVRSCHDDARWLRALLDGWPDEARQELARREANAEDKGRDWSKRQRLRAIAQIQSKIEKSR